MASSHDVNIRWIEGLVATPENDPFSKSALVPLTRQPSPTEHVLRGSRSFAARSFRSRVSGNSLRVPSNKSNNENFSASAFESMRNSISVNSQPVGQVLGEIPANGQVVRQGPFKTGRSPTPSLKKKKAEAIVRAHGSPTHVRVTAGGRIVPSDQSPLCHPRFGYSAVKTNGGLIKFAPNYPAKPQWTQATENGFVAQDMQGNLCQIVNGTILPLNEVDGTLRLYMPAPNLKVTQRGSSLGPINVPFAHDGSQQNALTKTNPVIAPEPSSESQITALELEYSKLEHELKDVDKTEVIHGRTMGKVAKEALITKRRELVMNMDKIRKAIKGLKNQPPPNAPTSPRAMLKRQSTSPPRNRLPPFLQKQQTEVNAAQAPFSVGNGLHAAFGGQVVPQPTPSPEELYTGHGWAMPPPGMFAPPPPFDGGMAPPFAAFSQAPQLGAIGDQLPSRIEELIPQNDGARSMADVQVSSPNQSRAVSIRAPEPKLANNLKSSLNPMSPVYKPIVTTLSSGEMAAKSIKDRVPTPLSPLRQLQPPAQNQKASTATNETISPAKKSTDLQSSSISSFETADFFPCNTREYSNRHYAYSFRPDPSDGKENADPELPAAGRDESPVTPGMENQHSPQQSAYRAPAPPPGTPVYQDDAVNKALLQTNPQGPRIDLPNRSTHNISPKSKREWLFVQEHPNTIAQQPSSSPEKPHAWQDEICVTASPYDTIDFSHKPREWIEGYQAGLQRRPIGADRIGDFLEGYCSGLLKSKPANTTTSTTAGPSTGSPLKPVSRRPSPAVPSRPSSQVQMIEKVAPHPRPPFETTSQSMDTLKQAVFAPQNENAVLTPGPDGPHVTEGSFNLGAWSRSRHDASNGSVPKIEALPGYPFPERTSSVIHRQGVMSEVNVDRHSQPKDARNITSSAAPLLHPVQAAATFAQQPTSPALSTLSIASGSIASGSAPNAANRISSLTSIESGMHRQWPGNRIMTPTEWKSGSSVAHAAGLATGYFSNAQFDGTHDTQPALRVPGQYTDAVSHTGANQAQRVISITSNTSGAQQGRFREGSLDGLSNPAVSPSQPMSPTLTPRDTPMKDGAKRKESSPIKGPSPAKAKFEHMAEKVGIKVTSTGKPNNPAGASATAEPVSPTGKRRWRDVWRKGGRDTE